MKREGRQGIDVEEEGSKRDWKGISEKRLSTGEVILLRQGKWTALAARSVPLHVAEGRKAG